MTLAFLFVAAGLAIAALFLVICVTEAPDEIPHDRRFLE